MPVRWPQGLKGALSPLSRAHGHVAHGGASTPRRLLCVPESPGTRWASGSRRERTELLRSRAPPFLNTSVPPRHPDALCGTRSRASKTALVLVKTLQKLQGAWPWAEQGPSVPRSRAGQSRPPGPGWGLRQEAWSLCRGRTGSTTARLFCPVASWRNENNNNF